MADLLRGNLGQTDIKRLISLLAKAKHSGCLEIKAGEKEGHIYFEEGKLYAAQTKEKQGYNALLEIFLFKDGEFVFKPNLSFEITHFKEDTLSLLQRLEKDVSIISTLDQKIVLIPVEKPVSLTSKEWKVIALAYKGLNLSQIMQQANIEVAELTLIIKRLENEGLIELTKSKKVGEKEEEEKIVPPLFWKALKTELAASIGPIAEAVIEDELEELGESKGSFPYHKAPVLVEKVSQEIEDSHERIAFQKQMLEILKKI